MQIQHQLPNIDTSLFPVEIELCDRHTSDSIAANDSIKPKLPPETENGISELDADFLLTATESFDSIYKGNANMDNLFRPSNKITTRKNENKGIPIDEITILSCDDSLSSFNPSGFEECQNISYNNPITVTVSENELEELDLDGCLSVSDQSDLGCCLSVFKESDSDFDYRNSSGSVDQSLSQNIKSVPKKENKCRIIPTPVNSPNNCDNPTSFQTLDIPSRVRPYQKASWLNHYKQLRQFHAENGHCCVPNSCPKYQKLVNWIKRQRRDYKQMKNGKKSGMSIERKHMLESIDFVWDMHDAVWREKLEALKAFRRKHGNCNVSYRSNKDKQLGTWVKAQRHQYKLYREGKPSSMNQHRIYLLTNVGIEWVGRSVTSKHLKK